ncbi:MAG: cytochrome ubiquinol oxidase subunit I [Thermoguttaceae bacterium]|nr:cytochrome ubiquinol oxidase subunit I [Thermoguttaceae bacterium]MDW8077705.1 cytochrome ubiquinol oxidase subunit I [Thermoguttaceae bacterium]
MHFPWWYVPGLTGPMLIAVIATLHVLVAHYAVGGGFFLAREVTYAYRSQDREYLEYLRRHARFFILITVVFGAITGVGIWWTIGLASPLATALLIQVFVFGWATEWVFFVMELTSAFLFLYCWNRIPAWLHQALGWIYAWAAWVSLVLITGITSFMLHPGSWPQTGSFWDGFLNPQFWPQVVARTGGAFLLASLYVYLHASIFLADTRLRMLVQTRSALPVGLGVALVGLGVGWGFFVLPEAAKAVIQSAPVITVFAALFVALTTMVVLFAWLGPIRFPQWLSPGFAAILFLMGLAAFSLAEFIREAIRKPYVVYDVVLGNQVFVQEVGRLREQGYIESGLWTKAYLQNRFPALVEQGRVDYVKLRELAPEERVEIGRLLFLYHCNDCHAERFGYSAVAPLIRGMDKEKLKELILNLNDPYFYMPPWCGREEEAELLAEYLATLAPPRPKTTIQQGIVSSHASLQP